MRQLSAKMINMTTDNTHFFLSFKLQDFYVYAEQVVAGKWSDEIFMTYLWKFGILFSPVAKWGTFVANFLFSSGVSCNGKRQEF